MMLKYTILSIVLLTAGGCAVTAPKSTTVTAEADCDGTGATTFKVGVSCVLW